MRIKRQKINKAAALLADNILAARVYHAMKFILKAMTGLFSFSVRKILPDSVLLCFQEVN